MKLPARETLIQKISEKEFELKPNEIEAIFENYSDILSIRSFEKEKNMSEIKKDLTDQDIKKILDEIDKEYEDIKNNPIEAKPPSNLSLMLQGVENNKALDFLFSSGLDHLIDKMMNIYFQAESIDAIINNKELIDSIAKKTGLYSKNKTKALITNKLYNALKEATSSEKFLKARTIMRKISLIIKKMKKEKKTITDKETRKKYEEVLDSFIKFFIFVAKIYKNRYLINEKVRNDISYVFSENLESYESNIVLESFIY